MASCWIEVNTSALLANYAALQTLVGPQCRLICVIKANAYGLGAIECGRELLDAGAAMLAVTRLDEALPLRAAGLTGDILLLTPALADEIESVVEHRIVACVADLADAQRLSSVAARRGVTARAHWKLDTGMGRLGTRAEDAPQVWSQMQALPHLHIEACFTHFAHAGDPDPRKTQQSFVRFSKALQELKIEGAHHCANSPSLVRFPSMRLSCVRPGTILYGQYSSVATKQAGEADGLKLRDPFAAKARIITIREVKPGESIGYGGEWTATRPARIATLAIGYADGLTLEPHARVESATQQLSKAVKGILKPGRATRNVTLHGHECPIVGRIAMQQCSIDVTGARDVKVGDVATVRMRRLMAGAHLPRLYVRD